MSVVVTFLELSCQILWFSFCSVPNLSSEWSFHDVEFIPIPIGTISDFPLTVTLRLECMRIIILLVLFSSVTCVFMSGVICDIRKNQIHIIAPDTDMTK